ncbi:MAG: hypothetical protein KKC68_07750, partial [Candidatus Thermoplasmatota archaeon]|nr:hypothetical protein [Candidatus Thermoplasmatota archaeon]
TTPPQPQLTTGSFNRQISGLQPGTIYHFRAWASNSEGTDYGMDKFFKTLGTQPTAPVIIGINPQEPIAASTRQWISIFGTGFMTESTITLFIGSNVYPIPSDRTDYKSSTQIDIFVGLTDPGLWSVQVTNPGNILSNKFYFTVVSEGLATAAIDQQLLNIIDQNAGLYYNANWNLNINQYKAWIATIAYAEGGNGGYSAHSQYGGGENGDRFDHKDVSSFKFSTGIGPFQLDRGGGTENWGLWSTIDKLNPDESVKSTMRWHYNHYGNGKTLNDFAINSPWLAVNPDPTNHWNAVTGTSWNIHKNNKIDLDWNTIKNQLAQNANDPIFPYQNNVQLVGTKEWNIQQSEGIKTETGKDVVFDGNYQTWLITSRSWSGTELFKYYYTYNSNENIEVWVWDNYYDPINKFKYIFVREYSTGPLPEHRVGSTSGETLSTAAIIDSQAEPTITSSLTILQSPPYYVDDILNAQFTIQNKGTAAITFSVLTAGGRDPDNAVADFTFQNNIVLHPGQSYNYQGSLTLTKIGNYHFFCAFKTPDDNWNTAIPTDPGIDNVVDITVSQSPGGGTLGYEVGVGTLGVINGGETIARTSDGVLHCVYHRSDGQHFQIYHSYSTDNGETWSEEPVTAESYDQLFPAIAVDSNNYLHVVWQGCYSESPTHPQIRYSGYTTQWSAITTITTDINRDQRTPAIAIDSNNNLHVIWQKIEYYGSPWSMGGIGPTFYSKRTAGSWSTPAMIGEAHEYNEVNASIVIDKFNYLHVAWTAGGYRNFACWHSAYRRYTTYWEPVVSFECYARYPSLATDSAGTVYLVYCLGPYDNQIVYRKRTESTSWSSPEVIAPYSSAVFLKKPSISVDSNHYLYVVWDDADGSIRCRKYTSSWQNIETLITDTDSHSPHLISCWCPEVNGVRTNIPENGYAFIWMDGPIITFYKSPDLTWENGGTQPPNQGYEVGTGILGAQAQANVMKLARTSNGILHCVYSRSDGLYSQIYHSYSSDNGETWTEEPLTSESYDQTLPAITTDSHDYLHVVWQGCYYGSPDHPQIRYRK